MPTRKGLTDVKHTYSILYYFIIFKKKKKLKTSGPAGLDKKNLREPAVCWIEVGISVVYRAVM